MQTDSEGLLLNTKEGIVTYTGRVIKPLSPSPRDICIEDIAHSLANQCRFTGHVKQFYSVAQHSILVSEITDFDNALWGLLHDASEAYLSDIARPIKRGASILAEEYAQIEERLMFTIARKFGLSWPMPEDVSWADTVLLRTEVKELMPFEIPGETLDQLGPIHTPRLAKVLFLERFNELSP